MYTYLIRSYRLLNNQQMFDLFLISLIHHLQGSVGLTSHSSGYTLNICIKHPQSASPG